MPWHSIKKDQTTHLDKPAKLRLGSYFSWLLWLLCFSYCSLSAWKIQFPFGGDPYFIALERAWSISLAILLLVFPLYFRTTQWPASIRRSMIFAVIICSLGYLYFFNTESRLRRAILDCNEITLNLNSWDSPRGHSQKLICRITDKDSIQNLANSVVTRGVPYRLAIYFCRQGEFTLNLLDEKAQSVDKFDIVNQGNAVLWRDHSNADLEMSESFVQALQQAFFQAIPADNGLSLPEEDSHLLSFSIGYWESEESVKRLTDKLPYIHAPIHRKIIAIGFQRLFGKFDAAVPPLLVLAHDADPDVRQTAFLALADYRHVPEVEAFLQGINVEVEPVPAIREAIVRAKTTIIHQRALDGSVVYSSSGQ